MIRGVGVEKMIEGVAAAFDGAELRHIKDELDAVDQWLTVHQYSVQIGIKLFRAGAWLLSAYFFSGAPSGRAFAAACGLSRRPTLPGWCAAWAAVGIALLDRYAGSKGLTAPNPVGHGFYRQGGGALFMFVIFVISVGPFFEEVTLRGFMYKAFRSGYGGLLSTSFVLAFSAYFHWSSVSRSMWTFGFLMFGWALFCLLRERTSSTWNCVLAHASYNAAQMLAWPLYAVALVLVLPLCLRGRLASQGTSPGSAPIEQPGPS